MKKILALTGVTGKKSGRVLVDKISLNYDSIIKLFPGGIRVIARKSPNIDYVIEKIPNVDIRLGDFSDLDFLKSSLEGVDTLCHIAGIGLSVNIVDACVSCNVRRVILVHTTGVYSKYKNASSDYIRIDNYVIEKCKQNSIIYTMCRPTMIYGNIYDCNVVKFIKMVDKFPIMPIVNDARYKLQPVHYSDLGEAYYQIIVNEKNTSNREFNLSGGEEIYLRDMLIEIGKQLGKNVKFIRCPFAIAYFGSWILYLFSFNKIDYRERVQRLCEPRIFSYQEAHDAFEYSPMTFKQGIVDEVREYKENS